MGSADAIYQSLNAIEDERPDIVVAVSYTHLDVYKRQDLNQPSTPISCSHGCS